MGVAHVEVEFDAGQWGKRKDEAGSGAKRRHPGGDMRRLSEMALWAGILILPLATFAQFGAEAQENPGRRLAEKRCARCHAIGETGLSPHGAAPPFRAIAAKGHVDDLQEALAEGIMVGHQDMPEFEFQPQEIVDFLAYLKRLAPRNN